MPRAIDPGIVTGGGLPTNHNPLSRVDFNTVAAPIDLLAILAQAAEAIVTGIQQFIVPIIEEISGIALHSMEALIQSLFAIPNFMFGIASSLLGSGFGFLNFLSPINATNLYNQVPVDSLGFVPFSAIGEGNPNLLTNPSFDGAESVQGGAMWFWDEGIGLTSPGSVYCVANGQLKQLRSNPIPVSVNQELDISIGSMWGDLVYTGTPIKLQVVRLLEGEDVGVDDLASPTTPGLNQSTWLKIGNPYTVPGGCDSICVQIAVAATATAGTIRFDDGDVHKTGSTATFVPFWNVLGVGGPANIGASIIGSWNNLISGFVGIFGGGGAGLADLNSVGEEVSSMASLGKYSWEVLGIRDNKPIDQGLLATSSSNFSLGRVAMQSSAPTIPVTQAVSAIGFLRMAESNDKGVVSWLGYGNSNITGCFVNVWKMDITNGDLELVHRSPNLVGLLTGGSTPAWVVYDYPDDMLLTKAGELYGIEITIVGSGTHTMCGTTTWMPPHPTSFPKTYAATRNSGTGTPAIGTVIPGASVVYATNIPWIEWGIVIEAGFGTHPDEITQFTEEGDGTLPVPSWAKYVDVIVLGGGGGGGLGGYFGSPGYPGGGAGQWATETWERGADFSGATVLDITVGAGGAYPDDGEDSVVSITGHTVTGAGGIFAGSPNQYGEAAGNQEYLGLTYVGGEISIGEAAIPGSGGTSGNDFYSGPGFEGARGGVWIAFREND